MLEAFDGGGGRSVCTILVGAFGDYDLHNHISWYQVVCFQLGSLDYSPAPSATLDHEVTIEMKKELKRLIESREEL
ncbi:hypothetical protein V6N12_040376 [Hibiscus sabdariffa]|uniref:Uncharacterized protein n=1 Tax=Hibiscus sabdariffa TaxID=183260 RepID=A0ABR2E730_9ROSI